MLTCMRIVWRICRPFHVLPGMSWPAKRSKCLKAHVAQCLRCWITRAERPPDAARLTMKMGDYLRLRRAVPWADVAPLLLGTIVRGRRQVRERCARIHNGATVYALRTNPLAGDLCDDAAAWVS